jgi:hypothetical protein
MQLSTNLTLTLANAAALAHYAELAGRRHAGAGRTRLRGHPPALRQRGV